MREKLIGKRRIALLLGSSLAVALAVACAAPIPVEEDVEWSPPPLTGEAGELPEGRDIVRRAVEFIQSHERMGFEAHATYEVVQENGMKLQFEMLQRVALERPDRLHWTTLHDNGASETAWCQDGDFTMIRQPANVWARVDVPATLSDAIDRVAYEYNVPVPFVDLLSGAAADLWLGEGVTWVEYIGEALAEGHWTEHVALQRPGADIQLWFRKGDEPFPVKMAIVHTDEDGQPGFTARFRKWATKIPDGAIPPFEPPDGSERLEIVPIVRP